MTINNREKQNIKFFKLSDNNQLTQINTTL
jgi:hypothetical protein